MNDTGELDRLAAPTGPGPRGRAADPVTSLMRRHHDLCARAVDPLEIAAGLEAHGLTDRAAGRFRHRDVFSLAEEMYARAPRAGRPTPAPPTAARVPLDHWAWDLLSLLPGALGAATVTGLRCTQGAPRAAVAALGVLAVALGLRTALARGALRTRGPAAARGAAFTRRTSLVLGGCTTWLLGYALLGDGLLRTALDGGPDGPWPRATAPVLALTLACLPAAWCARLFAIRVRRGLAVSRGLKEFASALTPVLLGVLGLFLCALGALLALCGALLDEPAGYAGAVALGASALLARLLVTHGSRRGPAAVLGAASAAEALSLAIALAGRLPGCSALAAPVRTLADTGGAAAVPALICASAALTLLALAIRTLTRASANAHPPGSP
ncbi:hypothetical protein AB0C59_12160 [Streptomyces sp. NPDC048664]|uniref:hypothetical protein n=1 Tax=Streptomyces sp. NPDC048664 TaxID=3154505 RepID=UPI00343D1A62